MKRRLAGDIRGSFSMSAGWLFADLLLVLAMLFLAANTMGIHPPPRPTPTPTVTPTQAPLAQLEQKYHEFPIYVDRQAFLNNDPAAVRSVTQQIVSQTFLRGRSAGLIVAYGTDTSDCDVAYQAAQKVYNLVRHIGQSATSPSRKQLTTPRSAASIRISIRLLSIYFYLQNEPLWLIIKIYLLECSFLMGLYWKSAAWSETMGASGWIYYVPYQENLEQALQDLRKHIFLTKQYGGAYNDEWVIDVFREEINISVMQEVREQEDGSLVPVPPIRALWTIEEEMEDLLRRSRGK